MNFNFHKRDTPENKPAVKKNGGYPVFEIAVYVIVGLLIATLSL